MSFPNEVMASQVTTALPGRPTFEKSNSIRISLHDRQSSLSSFGSFRTTAISKHYALNNQILTAFEHNYQKELWQTAYHFGLKFVESALLEIPKHGYFYADKYADLRSQSTIDALRVCHALQEIITINNSNNNNNNNTNTTDNDSNEANHGTGMPSLSQESHRIELLYYLATEQFENLSSYEASRKRVKREIRKVYPRESATNHGLGTGRNGRNSSSRMSSTFSDSLTSTILACGDSFTSVFCPGGYNQNIGNVAKNEDEYISVFPDQTNSTRADDSRSHSLYPSLSSEARQPEESISWRQTRKAVETLRDDKSSTSLLDDIVVDTKGEVLSTSDCLSTRSSTGYPHPHPHPHSHHSSSRARLADNIAMGIPVAKKYNVENSTLPNHLQAETDYDLQRALFISGLEVNLGVQDDSSHVLSNKHLTQQLPKGPPGAKTRDEAGVGLSFDVLSSCYHDDFDELRRRGSISIHKLPTYQGRISGSINGCTVIAPLLCMHYFLDTDPLPDRGLADNVIVQVIDEQTPNILPKIREELGLVKDSFLIPVDAHESLMQQNYLCQDQFQNVCGGNILDESHLQSLIDELNTVGQKKLAASLFFHEHMITILQLRRDTQTVCFDIIDSMPHKATFLCSGEQSIQGSYGDIGSTISQRSADALISRSVHDSLRLESERTIEDQISQEFLVDEVPILDAVRIRCMNAESLKATIRWYACSVFSPENRAYIDTYEWDERLTDFDPRVFQAFIWTESA